MLPQEIRQIGPSDRFREPNQRSLCPTQLRFLIAVMVVVVMMIMMVVMLVLVLVLVVMVMVVVIAGFSEVTELRESTILEIERRRKGFEAEYGRMEGLIENRLGKRVDSDASSVTRKRVEFCGADWIREGFHFV